MALLGWTLTIAGGPRALQSTGWWGSAGAGPFLFATRFRANVPTRASLNEPTVVTVTYHSNFGRSAVSYFDV